jgi:uncharacterized membrane protein
MMTEATATFNGDSRVLVASFATPNGASLAATRLQELEKQGLLDVDNTVTAIKNDQGQVEVKNISEVSVGDGAKIGAIAGGVVGLLFPPSILASAALGGLLGGITAKLRETGFDPGLVKEMAESMDPGTSMLVTVVAPPWTADVETALSGTAHKIAWVDLDQAARNAANDAASDDFSI